MITSPAETDLTSPTKENSTWFKDMNIGVWTVVAMKVFSDLLINLLWHKTWQEKLASLLKHQLLP